VQTRTKTVLFSRKLHQDIPFLYPFDRYFPLVPHAKPRPWAKKAIGALVAFFSGL